MSNVRTWLAEKSDEERKLSLSEAPRLCLEGGRIQRFCRLLGDFDFIEAKINHPQLGLQALINDYELIDDSIISNHPEVKVLKLIQGALQLSTHILAEDKTQLATQLYGRLIDFKIAGIQALLEQVKQSQKQNQSIWLCPLSSSLIPAGGRLLRVLTGHRACVNTVIVTPDGRRIISGADDGTLKVWDLETGKELFNLASDSAVTTVVITPDSRRLISSSNDGILKVWDLETKEELFALGERDDIVKVIAITPDGKRVISDVKGRIREIPLLNKIYSEITQKMRDKGTAWNLETIISSKKRIIRKICNLQEIYSEIIQKMRDKGTVWNLKTGKREFTFKGSYPVTSIAVTPDGTQMILGSVVNSREGTWGTIIVQNVETGEELFTLNSSNIITAIATTLDGEQVISGSIDGTLTIWNLKTRKEEFTLTVHSEEVTAIATTLDGERVISGSIDGTLTIWNLKTRKEEFTLTGHSEEVTAVAITPNGKLVISGSKDKTLKIWSLESEDKQFSTHKHNNQVNDNNQVNVNLPKKNVLIILLETICQVFQSDIFRILLLVVLLNWIFSYFNFPTTIFFIIFFTVIFYYNMKFFIAFMRYIPCTVFRGLLVVMKSSIKSLIGFELTDSFTVILPFEAATSDSKDKTCKVEKIETRKQGFSPTSHSSLVNAVTITPDGERAISTSDDKTLKVWNLKTREELFTLTDRSSVVNTIVTDTNSKQLIFSSSDKTLKICNFEAPNKILTFRSSSQIFYNILRVGVSVVLIVCVIIISFPNFSIFKMLLWALLGYGSFYLIDTMKLDDANAIVVTPDDQRVVSGSKDKTLKVWNLKTRWQLFTLKGHSEEVTAVAVIPESGYLISGSRDKTLRVWNLQKRKELFTLGNHESWVNTVCVTPDGKQVLSGSQDTTIKIWDLENRNQIFTIQGHSDSVESVVVTPDGKYLISASSDSTLKVWNLESREVIASFSGDSALCCCAVAPNGVTIVTGEASGQVHFLRLEKNEA